MIHRLKHKKPPFLHHLWRFLESISLRYSCQIEPEFSRNLCFAHARYTYMTADSFGNVCVQSMWDVFEKTWSKGTVLERDQYSVLEMLFKRNKLVAFAGILKCFIPYTLIITMREYFGGTCSIPLVQGSEKRKSNFKTNTTICLHGSLMVVGCNRCAYTCFLLNPGAKWGCTRRN